ncbi:MAG: hypothetical protein Q9160_000419 [Pyrenula sp. 1 TL-2023]
MSSLIRSSKITLSYPIFCADFDPQNAGLLIVGGGGGAGRTGVGNCLTLLNTSRREEISKIVEIDLSKSEDSVSSLAVAQSSDTFLTAYAGINSSEDEQRAKENRHLRSFRIDHPLKINGQVEEKPQEGSGKTTALSQASFFKPSKAAKKETYQRVLRLSPPGEKSPHRIAAIASSLAEQEEIVIFRAVSAPQKSDELGRISLGKTEAADIDIAEAEEDDNNSFQLAYCTDSAVYTVEVSNTSAKAVGNPGLIHAVPQNSRSSKAKLRSLKFITPEHILLLQNKPQRTGAELLILGLNDPDSQGSIVLRKRLHKTTKAALHLDVCHLSKSDSTSSRQTAIAIASQSGSIELLSITYNLSTGHLSKFSSYAFLSPSSVAHPASITSLRFSHFNPPPLPITSTTKPQNIKLASTSIASTVVVHTIPLSPEPPPPNTTPRFILNPSSPISTAQTALSVFNALLVIGIGAFLLQAFTEIRGGVPPYLGATDWLSPRMRELIARPYMFSPEGGIPRLYPDTLHDLVRQHVIPESQPQDESQSATKPKAIIVRQDPSTGNLETEVRPAQEIDTVNGQEKIVKADTNGNPSTVRKWEDLSADERAGWRTKLKEAGQWAEGQGEAVLKGVFFGELAGLVGGVVGGA